jgi:DNA modification methylase
MPWAVAFALRSNGWYLRSDIIWSKPNPMPESVTDRPTKAHEYIFLMAKNDQYYYDADAIKELAAYDGRKDTMMKGSHKYANGFMPVQSTQSFHARGHERWQRNEAGDYLRNKRTVWHIPTKPYNDAHFATFPTELVETCIKPGCPVGGIVLDPFMGSGTTGEVALKLNRRFIGFELNPEYVKLANKRIFSGSQTLDSFTDEKQPIEG